jgi:predicted metal-binding membrane protein
MAMATELAWWRQAANRARNQRFVGSYSLWHKANMSGMTERGLDFLPPAASRLGRAAARPRPIAILCIVALTALGWLYLGLAQGRADLWAALCRPLAGSTAAGDVVLTLAMWSAMVLAMMLPSAAPMVLTYAEIADTAARKGERIVSPFVLTAGYAAVWLGFALLATGAHLALTSAFAPPAAPHFAAALFIGAGLYQFSALKQACLHQCRSPFPFFFANWSTTPRGVFRLGLRQGLYCLGCCWAAMLLMFAFGAMNIVWMALLGALMTAEKLARGAWFARALGIGFIAIGVLYLAGVGI